MSFAESMKQVAGQKPLQGPDKVAALLLAMGKPLAGRLLKHFDPDELKQITRCVAELGIVGVPTLEVLIEEFAGQFLKGVDLLGSAAEVEQLLAGVMTPEQIADLMSDVTGDSNSSIWEQLSDVAEATFAAYLIKEHPQTTALILSKVTSACAAKVMGQLPRDLRNQVMRRMLSFTPVTEQSMRILEGILQQDLIINASRKQGADPNARMADIINKMERDQMEDVLQSLAEVRPQAAETLRGMLFTFEDLVKLPPRSRMVLFDKIQTDQVVIALKGTDQEFRDTILSALAARARRVVESELQNGGPASQRDVMKARRAIADIALQMSERGELELTESEDEDQIF